MDSPFSATAEGLPQAEPELPAAGALHNTLRVLPDPVGVAEPVEVGR